MARALAAAAIAAFVFTAGTAAAQTPGPHSGEQADIPFATHDGIRTFTASADRDGVYLQDNRKNWYYASFAGPCWDIDSSIAIGFKTFGGSSTLSRGDTIFVGRETCHIIDLVHSGPPPEKPRKARKAS